MSTTIMHTTELIINVIFELALFINASLFLPQAIRLIRFKNAENLSLTSFAGFNLIQVAIIAHGVLIKDWLLVIGMCFTFVTCGLVTGLIIFYNYRKMPT